MARFYLPAEEWLNESPLLRGDEARHALKVLRMHEGDALEVFDGNGRSASARISSVLTGGVVGLTLTERCECHIDLPRITLCQSIPKGGNMELIIQKAVELGVSRIIPLMTERTIVRLNEKEKTAKQTKWERTALEACKQCGQNLMPVIDQPQNFSGWIKKDTVSPIALIASLADGAEPIRNLLENARSRQQRDISVLIGPEGDFTPEELELALAKGFKPVTLGPIVLRVETASFFCLSAIRYALD